MVVMVGSVGKDKVVPCKERHVGVVAYGFMNHRGVLEGICME